MRPTNIPLDSLRPAQYNPRRIIMEQFEQLKESLTHIGCVLPVLVNRENNIIIAGHQRSRAMKAVGMKTAPAFYVSGINAGDEMTFNQLHNGTEIRTRGTGTYRGFAPVECFTDTQAEAFAIQGVSGSAVKEICKLLTRYGNVLSCVVCAGRVYLGAAYVRACQCLRLPVNVYVVDATRKLLVEKYFGQDYGEYCYDGLERRTYVQGMAQLNRNVEMRDDIRKQNKSHTYVGLVHPFLAADPKVSSVLDFGCGKGAYIADLARRGYDALGVEFFNQNGVAIDVAKGNAQIDALVRHLRERGRFDVVVCDSVLNSVDSMEAEHSVLRCLNAFCKPGGTLFVSGRTLKSAVKEQLFNYTKDTKSMIRFLDDQGFTAKYRRGSWYFQKFHDRVSFKASLDVAALEIEKYVEHSCSFASRCRKTRELTDAEAKAAIDFEFDLPLPHGRRYGRHADVWEALNVATKGKVTV